MYWCWNCSLWMGEPDTPVEPSQLCGSCKSAEHAKDRRQTEEEDDE